MTLTVLVLLAGLLTILAVRAHGWTSDVAKRDPEDPASEVLGLMTAWMTLAAGFVIVVAIVASIMHAVVTKDELAEAAVEGAARVDGELEASVPRLEVEIGAALGRAVSLTSVDDDDEGDEDQVDEYYVVTAGEDPDPDLAERAHEGDVFVCVRVTQWVSDTATPRPVDVYTFAGVCPGDD